MAARKIKDIAVKTGSYTDRSTGDTKGRYQNVGALMKTDDGNVFIILERWFNPAGIADPDNRGNVLLSCFDLRDADGNKQEGEKPAQKREEIDDSIPF